MVLETTDQLPTISVIIPTLNSGRTLRDCLDSIVMQDYPKEKIEIIIADGGSTDGTLEIINSIKNSIKAMNTINSMNLKVVPNPLKTGEAGKAVGLRMATGEIVAFIDSDNILPELGWLKRMVEPFDDPEIIASEPIEYTYRPEDGYITRYCALLGMNDPLCLFLGNYDRYCTLTGQWTEMPHKEEDKGDYLKIGLDKLYLPTIGANGFLIRRLILEKCNIGDYLFDIDVIYELLDTLNLADSMKIAKVKTGIIHIFSGTVRTFAKKQRRRIRDYLFYDKLGIRKYPWKGGNKRELGKFILFCVSIIPLLIESYKGYTKNPDKAWVFHPIACWLTLWEYGWGRIGGIFGIRELKRERWRQ